MDNEKPWPVWKLRGMLRSGTAYLHFLESALEEALSIIRSAQTNAVYNEAKAFIEKVEGEGT